MPAMTGFMEHEYQCLVNDLVQDAIDHREDWIEEARHDESGWNLTVNKRNMQVFRKKIQMTSTSSNTSLYSFLTVGYLTTTIDELHAALYTPTTKDDQIMHSLLLEKEFMTSQVLQTLKYPRPALDVHTPDFFGVKYIKLRMPGSRLGVHPRDSVYLEYLTLREPNILVKVVHSIDDYLPNCSDSGVIHRATLRDVWLFVPAHNGKVQVVAKTFHDMKGSAPKYFSDQSALSFWRVHDKLVSLSSVRRLLALNDFGYGRNSVSSLARSQPITRQSIQRATNERSHCQCCRRKFTLFHGKRLTCSHCSLTMCTNCHLRVQYSVQSNTGPVLIEKVHLTPMTSHDEEFCLVCVHRSKETFKDFDRVNAPEQDDDVWEANQEKTFTPETTTPHNYKPRESEFELRLSKEDQPPVQTPHRHAASIERRGSSCNQQPTLKEDDVFHEMRKSIAIQESILSAMRASWHGHTEQEMYVHKEGNKHRVSEYTFEKDCDRFEVIE